MGRMKTISSQPLESKMIITTSAIKIVVPIGEEIPGSFLKVDRNEKNITFYFAKRIHVDQTATSSPHTVRFDD